MLKKELREELEVKGIELTDGEFNKSTKKELEVLLKTNSPKQLVFDVPEIDYSKLVNEIKRSMEKVIENNNKNTDKVISTVNELKSTVENIADKYTKELIRRINSQMSKPQTKENKYVCKVLGKVKTPYGVKNIYGKCSCCGKEILEPGVVKYSKIHFGQPTCRACQKKALEKKAVRNHVANK